MIARGPRNADCAARVAGRAILIALLVALFRVAAPTPQAAADLYGYTDEEGNVHIVADPSQVPERYLEGLKKQQEETSPGASQPQAVAPASPSGFATPRPTPGSDRARSPEVEWKTPAPSPDQDFVVCFDDTSDRWKSQYLCSTVLVTTPDKLAPTLCREHGYPRSKLFKHRGDAEKWTAESCWSAWRKAR